MLLTTPIRFVRGVGEQRALLLGKSGIQTTSDLLRYKPFRYEDRTSFLPISEVLPSSPLLIKGIILKFSERKTRHKQMKILELLISDDSGTILVKFFNQPYLLRLFHKGQKLIIFGVPRLDGYSHRVSMINPHFEIITEEHEDSIHIGRIVPIYRRTGTMTTRQIRTIVSLVLQGLKGVLEDDLPEWLQSRYGFPTFEESLNQLHFPDLPVSSDKSLFMKKLEAGKTPSQQRLAYEEFFDFQRGLNILRSNRSQMQKKRKLKITPHIRDVIKSILPFHPTSAQKKVLKEIAEDLGSNRVMSRLLQGDVGSGKTIVAVQAIIIAIENKLQAVLMAPTEILAEQHYETLTQYLTDLGYSIALLTRRVKGQKRQQVLKKMEKGEIQIVIGTHSVFQKGVFFKKLGLVIIDEQHRFGVYQRSQLQKKGQNPDTLVMTATPIPRSLALTLYGDLDLSIIDELPPGRQPIQTVIRTESHRRHVYEVLKKKIINGQQCYIVFPLVEESDKLELRSATEMAKKLRQTLFCNLKVALLHGRLSGEEKDNIMCRFKNGEVDVLVSTTVIEVGIDVPNASLMVIEHANRFGLAQLHQLRGRIGRGQKHSYCVLLTESGISSEARERLRILQKTNDGFQIAEKDLELRGPGDFVGTKQSGLPQFHFANLVRDQIWLERAQVDADEWLTREFSNNPTKNLAQFSKKWKKRFGLFHVG